MADDVIFQGGQQALIEGLLEGSPDIRLALLTADFTGYTEKAALVLDDFTDLAEFQGLNYQRLDCQSVTFTWDAVAEEFQLECDAGEFNPPGVTISPGPDAAEFMLLTLHVDGTPANDIPIGVTDRGGFPINGVGTAIFYTPHGDGLFALRAES